MPLSCRQKDQKIKTGATVTHVWGNLKAACLKDRSEVYVLTNSYTPPAEGNFRDKCGSTSKPQAIECYSTVVGYVDRSSWMSTSYSMKWKTCSWTKKLFFWFTDLIIVTTVAYKRLKEQSLRCLILLARTQQPVEDKCCGHSVHQTALTCWMKYEVQQGLIFQKQHKYPNNPIGNVAAHFICTVFWVMAHWN